MIIGVIQKPDMKSLAGLIQTMDASLYDILELRLDACKDLSVRELAALALPLPTIFTLRCQEQGGIYTDTEESRLHMLEELMRLRPAYMDIESTVDAARIERIRKISPETTIILSEHDFEKTPASIEDMVAPMRKKASGVIYKFATFAHSTLDALRMLTYCKEQKDTVIGICMGEYGETTRILAPVVHCGFSYCPVEESSAPGQIDSVTLRETYNFSSLNKSTEIYGLLGDPVMQSVGHKYHNSRNAATSTNAVYVKWRLTRQELPEAMNLLARLGVKGLSVTMPLKEKVVPLLAQKDGSVTAIGATNTIRALSEQPFGWKGTNTDGAGAIASLNVPLAGKRVIFLGAGGAAKAIMYEAGKQTKDIRVYNRTTGKKLPVTAPVYPLADMQHIQKYDVLINTLPFDTQFPFETIPFRAGSVAMDISYGKKSFFLECAAKAGCQCVDGSGMFEAQARLQRDFWGIAR